MLNALEPTCLENVRHNTLNTVSACSLYTLPTHDNASCG